MNDKRENILFILPSLEGGGSQRVMLTIMTYMDRKKFNPKLALVKKEGEFLSQVPKDIPIYDLNAKQLRYAIFKIIKLIKSENPDIVFSTLGHLNLLLALLKPILPKKTLFIARESNTVSIQNLSEKYPKLFDWLFKNVYKNFDLIITQSHFMKDDLVNNYDIDEKKIKVIYNPLASDKIEKLANEKIKPSTLFDTTKINLLSVGRIDRQKGYDLLLESFGKLDENYALTILGEGEMKKELEDFVKERKLSKRVFFKGFSQNPYIYLKHADLFLLSSRYEGFANVVLEANYCELPVVAFKAPGVNDEIVKEGFNGFLVENFDTDLFAQTIEKASKYRFDKKKIKKHTEDRYDGVKIVKEYENIVKEAHKKKSL